TVLVRRKEAGIYPVTVAVYGTRDTAYATVDGVAEDERVTIVTQSEPKKVMLDPIVLAHDWNMLDNQFTFSWLGINAHEPPKEKYFDTWFTQRQSRDALTLGLMPMLWYNDIGGTTLGLRTRTDYLGMFEQNTTEFACGTRDHGTDTKGLDRCGAS